MYMYKKNEEEEMKDKNLCRRKRKRKAENVTENGVQGAVTCVPLQGDRHGKINF